MGPVAAVRTCLQKYGTFSGRAQRPEYWWFYLFHLIAIAIPLAIGLPLAASIGSGSGGGTGSDMNTAVMVLSIGLAALLLLALTVPSLAVTSRRIHDTGQSGWWQLIVFVPNIGGLALIIWCCLPGTPGDNKYGLVGKVEDVFA
jgi:uncharacterized membrane protein YhaH (DUF805 family)